MNKGDELAIAPNSRSNYVAKMEMKRQADRDAGLVSERFPTVAGIEIQMTYYHRAANPLLMVRTVNVYPTSYANFRMDCMTRDCKGGGYDLNDIVSAMIRKSLKVGKGVIECEGSVDGPAGSHARIEYEALIQYKRS